MAKTNPAHHLRQSGQILMILLLWLGGVQPGPAQAQACAETYVVQANDWLSKIAAKFLGDFAAYPALVAATNALHQADPSFPTIENPDRIEVGWKLCVPANPEAEALLGQIITSPPLSATPAAPAPPGPIDGTIPYTLDDFMAEFAFGPDLDPAWIQSSPDLVAKREVGLEFQQRQEQYGYRANYLWNEKLSDDYLRYAGLFKVVPPQVKLFPAPGCTNDLLVS
jgi:hypothetical protein